MYFVAQQLNCQYDIYCNRFQFDCLLFEKAAVPLHFDIVTFENKTQLETGVLYLPWLQSAALALLAFASTTVDSSLMISLKIFTSKGILVHLSGSGKKYKESTISEALWAIPAITIGDVLGDSINEYTDSADGIVVAYS